MSVHGLVLGKFYPPHKGHDFLIRSAAAQCDHLTVVVMAARVESIPLGDRLAWLKLEHANETSVSFVGVTDDYPTDFESDKVWEKHMALVRNALSRDAIMTGKSPLVDVVFTSEEYGGELGRRLGAKHALIDLGRATWPVSGTLVRAGVIDNWQYLSSPVQAGLTQRVVVLGAESTGTTTLSLDITAALKQRGGIWQQTRWVREYGRDYTYDIMQHEVMLREAASMSEPAMLDLTWPEEDFTFIAQQQNLLEEEKAGQGSPVLVCDTDAFATSVWYTRYIGERSTQVEAFDLPKRHALYILTSDLGVPFVQDGIRDGEGIREWMTGEFKRRLTEKGVNWVMVEGSPKERLTEALSAVDMLLENCWSFASPLG